MTLNWPCDIQTIKNFLAEAEKENTLYKKAEKVSSWARLGVDEKNSCRITFFKNGSEKVSEFFFGIEDPFLKEFHSGLQKSKQSGKQKLLFQIFFLRTLRFGLIHT